MPRSSRRVPIEVVMFRPTDPRCPSRSRAFPLAMIALIAVASGCAEETPDPGSLDPDGDGVAARFDNCPDVPNASQGDWNADGEGDHCDDTDEDGLLDADDNCANHANANQADFDLDDSGDVCDDYDHDGIVDAEDNCRMQRNVDQADFDDDGEGDACDHSDDDTIDDARDNCRLVANDDQADFNHDGLGDACSDVDGDGVFDAEDNCRETPNPDQAKLHEAYTEGIACRDGDDDGVLDVEDNCLRTANVDQADSDGDEHGDACDYDDDDDGIADADDNCPLHSNPGQYDLDGDHLGDVCDEDLDGDGVANATDPCPLRPTGIRRADAPGDGCGTAWVPLDYENNRYPASGYPGRVRLMQHTDEVALVDPAAATGSSKTPLFAWDPEAARLARSAMTLPSPLQTTWMKLGPNDEIVLEGVVPHSFPNAPSTTHQLVAGRLHEAAGKIIDGVTVPSDYLYAVIDLYGALFTPDGKTLVHGLAFTDPSGLAEEIRAAPLDGSGSYRMDHEGRGLRAMSPDGTYVVTSRLDGSGADIVHTIERIDVERFGTGAETITTTSPGRFVLDPAFVIPEALSARLVFQLAWSRDIGSIVTPRPSEAIVSWQPSSNALRSHWTGTHVPGRDFHAYDEFRITPNQEAVVVRDPDAETFTHVPLYGGPASSASYEDAGAWSISADSKALIWLDRNVAPAGDPSTGPDRLMSWPLDASEPEVIAAGEIHSFIITAESRVVYLTKTPGSMSNEAYEEAVGLHAVNADGSDARHWVKGDGIDWPYVSSPDGRRIAFQAAWNENGDHSVFVYDADRDSTAQLTPPRYAYAHQAPGSSSSQKDAPASRLVFSESGRYLLIVRASGLWTSWLD